MSSNLHLYLVVIVVVIVVVVVMVVMMVMMTGMCLFVLLRHQSQYLHKDHCLLQLQKQTEITSILLLESII